MTDKNALKVLKFYKEGEKLKLFSQIALRVSDELYNLDNEQIQACLEHSCQWPIDTGKSFSEASFLHQLTVAKIRASDKDLPVENQNTYLKKKPSSPSL